MFMSNDWLMFDEEQDMAMRAQSSNLNEELGQVEYVFSDKTGTLTCNVMQFKKFTAGPVAYGTSAMPVEPQEDNVCFHDPNMQRILQDEYAENNQALVRVLVFLACCHTIIIDTKKGKYNSSSPDELALVNAAKQFGYIFKERDEHDNIIVQDTRNDKFLKYKLLNVCEFTSTRKRMSCIFRDPHG
jgi:phospholipid-transporting ATPase